MDNKVLRDAIWTALVMVVLEYFVVMPRYIRDPSYFWITLLVVFLFGFISVLLAEYLIERGVVPRWTLPLLIIGLVFIVELPLAFYGPEVTPKTNPYVRSFFVGLMTLVSYYLGRALQNFL